MVKGMMERVKWKTWHTTTKKRPPNSAGQWSRRLKSGHVRGPRKAGWKSVEIYGEKWGPCHTIFQLLWLPWSPLLIFSPRNGNKRTTLTVCYPHLFGGLQFSFAWFFFTPVFIFFIYIVFGSLLPFFFGCAPQRAPVKVARLTAAALSKRLARELPHDKRCPRRICQDLISVSLFACFFVGVPGQLEQQEALKQMHVILRFSQNHFFGHVFVCCSILFSPFSQAEVNG